MPSMIPGGSILSGRILASLAAAMARAVGGQAAHPDAPPAEAAIKAGTQQRGRRWWKARRGGARPAARRRRRAMARQSRRINRGGVVGRIG